MWTESRLHRLFLISFAVLLTGAFAAYFVYRQRYIGACDWFGYFELGRLMREGKLALDTLLPADQFPSLVPLGFFQSGAHGLPQYAPGYPLLLAIAGFVGAEFLVNPLIGIVSAVVLFLCARDLTGNRWVALATMSVWLFFPIVVFGSTTIMSDLVATVPLMASYLFYRRGRVPWSAFFLGFALWVRATNVLYCLVFALPLLRDAWEQRSVRGIVRYVAWLAVFTLPIAGYNWALFGAPWKTGYGSISTDLTREVFRGHLLFYLWETFRHVGPLWILIYFGCREGRRVEVAFFGLWTLAYIVFYSFWRSGGDLWWWTRFVMPGYPPLFFLTALGLHRLTRLTLQRFTGRADRTVALAAILAIVIVTPFYQIRMGLNHRDLWRRVKGAEFYEVVRTVEQFATPHAFVGSVEFAGSFRIYSSLVPFVSTNHNALELADEAFRQGRDVYLIIEPWNQKSEVVRELLARHSGVPVKKWDELWKDLNGTTLELWKLTPPRR